MFQFAAAHHWSLSFRYVTVMADFMRLLTDICREVRYFSKRKSHPSGDRAPITKTAIVMSTGRLQGRDRYYDVKLALTVFSLSKCLIIVNIRSVLQCSLTSWHHPNPSTGWRIGWLWLHREDNSWHKRTGADNSSALAQTPNRSHSILADQSDPGTAPRCNPETPYTECEVSMGHAGC